MKQGMVQPAIDNGWVHFYDGAFREHVHQLLAWGYEDARPEIDGSKEEEEITGFLCDAIQARLNSPGTPAVYDRYSVHNEAPVRGQPNTGKRRKRLDVVMECGGGIKPRPEFMFEAKRLAKGTHTISAYVGKDGLQCYTCNQYASEYTSAGMLGYIQSDNSQYWHGELSRKFSADTINEYKVVNGLAEISVLSELSDEWVSEHGRDNNTNIKVFHIFLGCQ